MHPVNVDVVVNLDGDGDGDVLGRSFLERVAVAVAVHVADSAHARVYDHEIRDVTNGETRTRTRTALTYPRVTFRTPDGPSARAEVGAVRDPVDDRIYVSGGTTASGASDELWALAR